MLVPFSGDPDVGGALVRSFPPLEHRLIGTLLQGSYSNHNNPSKVNKQLKHTSAPFVTNHLGKIPC